MTKFTTPARPRHRLNFPPMNPPMPSREYHVYLLRLWRDDESTPWRIQAEDPHTGEMFGFADLESLFAFLQRQTGQDGHR